MTVRSSMHLSHHVAISLFAALCCCIHVATELRGQTQLEENRALHTSALLQAHRSVAFQKNLGQWESDIRYRSKANGITVSFLRSGLSFGTTRSIETDGLSASAEGSGTPQSFERLVWNLRFEGMNAGAALVPEGEENSRHNYLRGGDETSQFTNVPHYAELWYRDIYDGIDLKYYPSGKTIEYDYFIRPGARVESIRMACSGIRGLAINRNGELEIATPWGIVVEAAPIAYQETDGRREPVDVEFILLNDSTYGFKVCGDYRRDRTLVIDPIILNWSTFVGGTGDGYITDIALDKTGNVYATGYYNQDFPTTPGVYDRTFSGPTGEDMDIFVFKLSADGSRLLYATYVGQRGDERGRRIAVNDKGEVYVCALASAAALDFTFTFPTTPGAFDRTPGGESDVAVFKLDATGTNLLFSTLLGGRLEESFDVVMRVGEDGDLYLAGTTESDDFPTTPNALPAGRSASRTNVTDFYIVRMKDDGSELLYSTFITGDQDEALSDIVVTGSDVILCGVTTSPNLPATPDALYPSTATMGYLCRIATSGAGVVYATGLPHRPTTMTLTASGELVIAGIYESPAPIEFPVTSNAYDADEDDEGDASILKLSADGTRVVYGTFLGGSDYDSPESILVLPGGEIVVSGRTNGSQFDRLRFPVTACADDMVRPFRSLTTQGAAVFVSRISANGRTLEYSTLLNGRENDYKSRLLQSPLGDSALYISLTTHSPNFPTTPGAYQSTKLNDDDDQPIILTLKPVIEPDFVVEIDACGLAAFADRSGGDCVWKEGEWLPQNWHWDFGDGTTSTEQNPIHYYEEPGQYQVKLVVGAPRDSIVKTVDVRVTAPRVSIRTHIPRDIAGMIGDRLTVPVVVDDDPTAIKVSSFTLFVTYDPTLMRVILDDESDFVRNSLIDGWSVNVSEPNPGSIRIDAQGPANAYLQDSGTLVYLSFETFLRTGPMSDADSVWTPTIHYDLILNAEASCAFPVDSAGQVRLSICGLRYRLIELTLSKYALEPSVPNPITGTADIAFSLGLDGDTRLEIFDPNGRSVAVLLDQYLPVGTHHVTWDASGIPSGLYYCRLSSGDWGVSQVIIVEK